MVQNTGLKYLSKKLVKRIGQYNWPSNAKVGKSWPFASVIESRFLEAPLVQQADVDPKNIIFGNILILHYIVSR